MEEVISCQVLGRFISRGETEIPTDDSTMTEPTPSRFRVFLLTLLLAVLGSRAKIHAGEPTVDHFAAQEKEYAATTRPLMKQFCLGCHSTEKQEGELDL